MMTPAGFSLLALLLVIVLSMTARCHIGVLALGLAWPLAVWGADWKPDQVIGLFPSGLFLTLTGVTLLFGLAQENGTLGNVTRMATRWTRGRSELLPWMFFFLAGAVSSLGPGTIAATALVAPLAMGTAISAGIRPFLMALMVGNGANAGNLSPLSAVGLIVRSLMEQAGLPGHEAAVFLANFTAHFSVSVGAYFLMGGHRIHRRLETNTESEVHLDVKQRITLAVLCLWAAGVLFGKFPPGLSSLAAVAVLFLLRAGEESPVFRSVPWSVILMVCGVSTLVGILEKTGGMSLFTSLLAGMTSPGWVNGTMAFVTGLISTYSSTSGVVYPAFLPTVPGLVERLGGGNPLEIALSINVGAALVDVSPLSTVGALCMAALPPGQDGQKLFRQLLIWGFSMVVVGALFCQFGIRYFAR